MSHSISGDQKQPFISGRLAAALSPIIDLMTRADQFIAAKMAEIGERYNWETWKWTGYQVNLQDPALSKFTFDEACKKEIVHPEERGGRIWPQPISNLEEKLEEASKAEAIAQCKEAMSTFAEAYALGSTTDTYMAKILGNLVSTLRPLYDQGRVSREEIQYLARNSEINRNLPYCVLDISLLFRFNIEGKGLGEIAKKPRETLKQGIECGLLNAEDFQLSLDSLDITEEDQRLTSSAILKCIDDSRLSNQKCVLTNFYSAAENLLNSDSIGINKVDEFLSSLSEKDFATPEWKSLKSSSKGYNRVQKIIQTALGWSGVSTVKTPKETDQYLKCAQRGIKSGLLVVGEETQLAYLQAAARVFDQDSQQRGPSGAFRKLMERLALGSKQGIMERGAQTLETLALQCHVEGRLPPNWEKTQAGIKFHAQIGTLLLQEPEQKATSGVVS